MKKTVLSTVAILLAAAMLTVLFGGCKIKEPDLDLTAVTEETTLEVMDIDQPPLAGGWVYSSEFVDVQMPEDATEMFVKATKDIEGSVYKPIAYLGSQDADGISYAYVCEITSVTENPVSTLNVIRIDRDREGNASVVDFDMISIAEYSGESVEEKPVSNGEWSFDEASGCKLPEAVKTAYTAVKQELEGSEYEPLVCLGSQVVAGLNYAILCKDVTDEGSASLSVIIVYAGVNGENRIVSVSEFAVPDFE